jgi:hypothetical protein
MGSSPRSVFGSLRDLLTALGSARSRGQRFSVAISPPELFDDEEQVFRFGLGTAPAQGSSALAYGPSFYHPGAHCGESICVIATVPITS